MAVYRVPLRVSGPFNTSFPTVFTLGGLLLMVLALVLAAWPPVQSPPRSAPPLAMAARPVTVEGATTLAAYPGLARAVREAIERDAYAVWAVSDATDGAVYGASNKRHDLSMRFSPDGVWVATSGADSVLYELGLRLTGYGYADAVQPAAPAELHTEDNRVEYRRGPLVEWYVNGPRGLQQGFTILERPGPGLDGELVLDIALSGGLVPSLSADGAGAWLAGPDGETVFGYTGLVAADARGKMLPARLAMRPGGLQIQVNDSGARYPIVIDPDITQQAKLVADDKAGSDWLGYSVAVSGDTAVLGAPLTDPGGTSAAGAAYVFVRSGTTWSQQAKLVAGDKAVNDLLGVSVAVAGDTAVLGAPNADPSATTSAGAAYVFVRSGTTWSQQAKLVAGDKAAGDSLGTSVAVSGETAVAGAIGADPGGTSAAGAAYVFVRSGTTWSQQAKLVADDKAVNDWLGYSVAVAEDTAVAGARYADPGGTTDAGAAYVFVRSGTAWSQQAKLVADDKGVHNWLGLSVAMSGETAVAGAIGADPGETTDAGAAYVFVRSGTTWSQQAKLVADDKAASDALGWSVAVSGETAVAGAFYADPGGTIEAGAAYVFPLIPTPRRPVLIIPGIGATYSADTIHDLPWLVNRGVPPSQMQIDPMTKVYDDLIQTLINVGYVQGKDLFIVNYDWRLPPGPDDESIDGQIDGLTAASISDQSYLYAVDYLGDSLRQAAEQWEIDHPGETLDAVDVITHSTGGLVARTYIQSEAYGGEYASGKALPKIDNLIMIGVPNRGASKAWNPLHDNWVVDPAFQMVLSKIINRAYQKVRNGSVIGGPDYNINLASISPPNCQDGMAICFINQYVPTARALLATYDFIDFGSGLTNVNSDLQERNTLLLDLNGGLDLELVGDPNAFADGVGELTVIYGTNGGATPTTVERKVGPTSTLIGSHPIADFAHFVGRDAGPDEPYYSDNKVPNAGDGTVPLISSRDQFVGDPRANITLMPFTKGGNTSGDVAHTALPYNIEVQRAILQTLGASFKDPTDISVNKRGWLGYGLGAIQCAVSCSNFGLDPVEGFMVDAQGRRLGFSAATGPMTEIPGSVWFGDAEGMGWVFGPVEEPLTIELTGLGESYYVTASVLSGTGRSGLIAQGDLGLGAQRVLLIETTNNTPVVTAGARSPLYTHRTWTLQVATFTDPDTSDTHTASINWGDGTVTPGTVNESAGTVTGSHRYDAAGTYTVTVTLTDNRNGSGQDTFQVTVRPHPRLRR